MEKSKIVIITGISIMIFGFSMYGTASSIETAFVDAPFELTSEEEFWFKFKDFGIRLFPVGLAGIIISMIGIVIRKKEQMKNNAS